MKTAKRREAQTPGPNSDSHQARLRPLVAAATIVGFAAILVSCAPISSAISEGIALFQAVSFQASVANLRDTGFSEQADAFQDGQVTEKEYRDSIQHLRSCVESAGYGFSAPQLSPVTGLTYEFVYHSNGRDETQALEHFNSCQDRYTTPLDTVYLSTHTQKMDPTLKSALLRCREFAGKSGNPDGNNLVEIAPITHEDTSLRGDARICIHELAPELFPALPSLAMFTNHPCLWASKKNTGGTAVKLSGLLRPNKYLVSR